MVVDDDPDLREMLQLLFSKEGYITETVGDGTALLNKIDSFNPDLVTLDVMMPGPSTKEILEQLQEKHSNPKIILLTVVRYNQDEKKRFLKLGNIVDYIKKPFEIDTLMAAIDKHV